MMKEENFLELISVDVEQGVCGGARRSTLFQAALVMQTLQLLEPTLRGTAISKSLLKTWSKFI
jgi:hypothetical protein